VEFPGVVEDEHLLTTAGRTEPPAAPGRVAGRSQEADGGIGGQRQFVAGQFPPLVDSEWVLGQDWHGDNHLVKIVLNGLQGVVTVKGQPYNNAMAPWGAVLKDDQIAAVLTYIRNEWGNKGPAIPVEFVSKVREQTKGRVDPWTQKELQAIGRELVGEAAAAPEAATPAASPAPAAAPGA
jgi:hypothetical protein